MVKASDRYLAFVSLSGRLPFTSCQQSQGQEVKEDLPNWFIDRNNLTKLYNSPQAIQKQMAGVRHSLSNLMLLHLICLYHNIQHFEDCFTGMYLSIL